ncbi:interleukin 2 receptor, gamma a [Diretmus argenteus]
MNDRSYSVSRFHDTPQFSECATYITENSTVIGCNHPYENLLEKRFYTFYTKLVHGNNSTPLEFTLTSQVKLYPPANLTVHNGTDSNLWFYWNHSVASNCVESEVRYRTNYNKWEFSKLSVGRQNYCINLPSSSCRYELQVRSSIGDHCGALRIILIPIVPNPPKHLDEILVHGNVEEWLHISKGLKEGFKTNFNERACSVREYSRVPQSASESSDSSTFSTTTDQTDFSASIPANESEGLSTSCSSSTSILPVSPEEGQTAP